MLGPQDIWVALALGIFFFGAKKLPELSRSLGQAMSEFKKGVGGVGDDAPAHAPAPAPAAPAPLPAPVAPPATTAVETVPAPMLSSAPAVEPAATEARGPERGSG